MTPDYSNYLSPETINFINNYSVHLSYCIKTGNLKDKISVYFKSDVFERISGWKISKIYRTHYYSQIAFDQFIFYTDSDKMGYVRQAAGLLCFFVTEREYELKLHLGGEPERVGIFYPVSKKQITGIDIGDVIKILNWELLPEALENWT